MAVGDLGTIVKSSISDGSVPGPLVVVHQDDYVELTLVNMDSNMMQRIDFQSATAALGEGLTLIDPPST